MAAMEELGEAGPATAGPSVLVLMLEEDLLAEYHRIVFAFRDAGIPAEVFPEPRKLAAQFAYAEKRGIPLAVIAGSDELAKGVVNLKDLRSRESLDGLSLEDATARASALLR
jgi:histidyl-tRNA synthetase